MRIVLLLLTLALEATGAPKHVVVIGVDGLGGEYLKENVPENIRGLMDRGAWTLKARGVMPTVSAPNWASMIMGAGPEQHGVTSNDWPEKFDFPPACAGSGGLFPTMFGLMREQRPRSGIVVVHDWEGFGKLFEKSAPTVAERVKGSGAAMRRAMALWKERRPELLFVHLDDVDHAGHTEGWGSEAYWAAVRMVDGLVGEMVGVLGEAKVLKETVILVTADHGGKGKSHGGLTVEHLYIPWIAAGGGIKAGELRQSVNTYDTAATVAGLFGLRTPGCWIGRAVVK